MDSATTSTHNRFASSGLLNPALAPRLRKVGVDREVRGWEKTSDHAVESVSKQFQGLKVLVVDDNVDAAQSLAMLLQAMGQETKIAHDGGRAIELALEWVPDVLLLDIGLPKTNGFQVASRIRQEPTLADVMLVALTGYGQDADRQRSQEAGFNHHCRHRYFLSKIGHLEKGNATSSIARRLLIAILKGKLTDAVTEIFTDGNGALNIPAFSVQKRPVLAFDVQIRGERSRPQGFPIRHFASNYNLAAGCCGMDGYTDSNSY